MNVPAYPDSGTADDIGAAWNREGGAFDARPSGRPTESPPSSLAMETPGRVAASPPRLPPRQPG